MQASPWFLLRVEREQSGLSRVLLVMKRVRRTAVGVDCVEQDREHCIVELLLPSPSSSIALQLLSDYAITRLVHPNPPTCRD
uniref:Uncharacterized protein n=1 Tax=Physcomitrium patens TaxID=3218 RepID=A0A2K1KHK5_PHYPA|nr:hypothetical protein PHYPA_009640 [Physcomitrium patens]